MKSMPYYLKQKLRQYDNASRKAKKLHDEIAEEFDKYKIPYENLTANADFGDYRDDPSTEGLAYINNCEGNIEDNIEHIEEIFLYFANKNEQK